MAHLLLRHGAVNARTRITELCHQFNYLLIVDFEATCEKNGTLQPQEIIEFPCLALCTSDWQVKDVFHRYIKPRVNPTLTDFCIELTGMMQNMIDGESEFPQVLADFDKWLDKGGYKDERTCAFVTCGDWDFRVMLPNQCKLDDLEVPKYFNQWIDLKKAYCEATNYYPKSLRNMLMKLDIPLEGRLHSGLWDAKNMVRIVTLLQKRHNAIFKITSSNNVKIKGSWV